MKAARTMHAAHCVVQIWYDATERRIEKLDGYVDYSPETRHFHVGY